MTSDKQIFLYFTIALYNVKHFQSLVQIWEMISNMTIKKVQDMLLKNEYRQVEKNGNKALNATALAHRNFNNYGQKVGSC